MGLRLLYQRREEGNVDLFMSSDLDEVIERSDRIAVFSGGVMSHRRSQADFSRGTGTPHRRAGMKMRPWITRIWPIVPILAALIATSALLVLFGAEPGEAFQAMFQGAFGDLSKSLSVMAFWVPLLLSATGLLVTFTAGLWNIGVEGQIIRSDRGQLGHYV
jgi:hypothetical protein